MKLVKEHINEEIKHLPARSQEEMFDNFFGGGKILFDEMVPFVQEIERKCTEDTGIEFYTYNDNGELTWNEKNIAEFNKRFKELMQEALEYCY